MNFKNVKEGGNKSMYGKAKRFLASFLAIVMAVCILPLEMLGGSISVVKAEAPALTASPASGAELESDAATVTLTAAGADKIIYATSDADGFDAIDKAALEAVTESADGKSVVTGETASVDVAAITADTKSIKAVAITVTPADTETGTQETTEVSDMVTLTYTVKASSVTVAAPAANPDAGEVAADTEVTLPSTASGAEIYDIKSNAGLQNLVLNMASLSAATYTESFNARGFTILATNKNSVVVDGNKQTVDGVEYTRRLKFAGKTTVENGSVARSISFETKAANAKVKVIAAQSNSSNPLSLKVSSYNSGSGLTEVAAFNEGNEILASGSPRSYSVTIPTAGTYYIEGSGGTNISSANIYYIEVTYEGVTDVYAPETKTVTFNANGGLEVDSQNVETGSCAAEVPTVRDGYNFMGWYADESCTGDAYNFLTPVTEDITLYAKWEEDSDRIDHVLNMESLPVGGYSKDFDKNGFTVIANGGINISAEDGSSYENTYDGTTYTRMLKLNGSGNTTKRSIKFNITEKSVLTIIAVASASTERELKLQKDNEVNLVSLKTTTDKGIFEVTQTLTPDVTGSDYYVYGSNAYNIYYISVLPQAKYDITLASVTADADHVTVAAGTTLKAEAGAEVKLKDVATATPAAGYKLTGWEVKTADGTTVNVTEDDTKGYVFTMPKGAVTVKPLVAEIIVAAPVFDPTVMADTNPFEYTFSTAEAKVKIKKEEGTDVYYVLSTDTDKYAAFTAANAKTTGTEYTAATDTAGGITVVDGMSIKAVAIGESDVASPVATSPVYKLGTMAALTGTVTDTQTPAGDIRVNDTVTVKLAYSETDKTIKYLYTAGLGADASAIADPAFGALPSNTPASGSAVYNSEAGITIPTTAAGTVYVKVLAYTEADNKVTAVASAPAVFAYEVKSNADLKNLVLNMANLSAAAYTESFNARGFTILAKGNNSVTVDRNEKTVDGVKYTQRLKFGGPTVIEEDGSVSRSISFETKAANAKVNVIVMSSNSSNPLSLNVSSYNADTKEFTEVTAFNNGEGIVSSDSKAYRYSVTIPAAGTYYIVGSGAGSANIYYIEVKYDGVTDVYTPETKTVTFNANGGLEVDAQNVESGGRAAEVPTVRDGYNFLGWYDNSGLSDKYNFSAPVTEDITLYAKWEEDSDRIDHVLNMERLSVGGYSKNFDKNGFTVMANEGISVEDCIYTDTESSTDYTRMLKLTGGGDTTKRSIKFHITEESVLTIIAVASGDTSRDLLLKKDNEEAVALKTTADKNPFKVTQPLTPDETGSDYYVYGSNAYNIFYISVLPPVAAEYDITLASVTADADHVTVEAGTTLKATAGTEVKLADVATATPAAGYKLTGWEVKTASGDIVYVIYDRTKGYVFTMPDEAVTVKPHVAEIIVAAPVFNPTAAEGTTPFEYAFPTTEGKVKIKKEEGTNVYYVLSTDTEKYAAFTATNANTTGIPYTDTMDDEGGIPVVDGMRIKAVAIGENSAASTVAISPVYRLGTMTALTGHVIDRVTDTYEADIDLYHIYKNDKVIVQLYYSDVADKSAVKFLYTVGWGEFVEDIEDPAFDALPSNTPASESSVYNRATGITIPTNAAGTVYLKVLAYTEADNKVTALASAPTVFSYKVNVKKYRLTFMDSNYDDSNLDITSYVESKGIRLLDDDGIGVWDTIYDASQVPAGGIIIPGGPSKDDYEFLYWRIGDKKGDKKHYYSGDKYVVTGDTTFFAVYSGGSSGDDDPDDNLVHPDDEMYVMFIDGKGNELLPETEENKNDWNLDNYYKYTGSKIQPDIRVYNYGKLLTEGTDYTVKYKNNVNASDNATLTVSGKGNLSGASEAIKFKINPRNINANEVDYCPVSVPSAMTLTVGSKPAPTIMHGAKKLGKRDFDLDKTDKYTEATAEGTPAILTVTGKGNYTGTATIEVTVINKTIAKKLAVKVDSNYKPTIKEVDGLRTLINSETNTDGPIEVYDSNDRDKTLVLGTDFDLVYDYSLIDNPTAGSIKFAVVGKGIYTNTVNKAIKVVPIKANAEDFDLSYDESIYWYRPEGVTVRYLKVYYQGAELSEGVDYKVKYSNNKKVSTGSKSASFTVNFIGNYKGSKPLTNNKFTIEKAGMDSTSEYEDKRNTYVTLADMTYDKAGKNYTSKPIVSVNGSIIKASEYTVEYYVRVETAASYGDADTKAKVSLGEADSYADVKAVIKLKENSSYVNYGDEISGTYRVRRKSGNRTADLTKAKIEFYQKGAKVKNLFYNGKEFYTPEGNKYGTTAETKDDSANAVYVKVSVKGKEVDPALYDVVWLNNKAKGKATVVINGKGTVEGVTETAVGGKRATVAIKPMVLRSKTIKNSGIKDAVSKALKKLF